MRNTWQNAGNTSVRSRPEMFNKRAYNIWFWKSNVKETAARSEGVKNTKFEFIKINLVIMAERMYVCVGLLRIWYLEWSAQSVCILHGFITASTLSIFYSYDRWLFDAITRCSTEILRQNVPHKLHHSITMFCIIKNWPIKKWKDKKRIFWQCVVNTLKHILILSKR